MKRILLLALGLSSLWSSGCCWYYSRHARWDDCYVGEEACVEEYREPRHKHRHKRRRDRNRCDDCGSDCCGGCCGSCCGSCDGGCGTCGVSGCNGCNMGFDGGASPMGGCASGNCGNVQTTNSSGQMYGGMPFDANSGWTIQ